MTQRTVIAYLLIFLWIAGAAGIAWWKIHHSRRLTAARESARRRQAEADHGARFAGEDGNA